MNSSKNNKRGGYWNQTVPCTEEEVGRLMLENIKLLLQKQESDIDIGQVVGKQGQDQGESVELKLEPVTLPSLTSKNIQKIGELTKGLESQDNELLKEFFVQPNNDAVLDAITQHFLKQ